MSKRKRRDRLPFVSHAEYSELDAAREKRRREKAVIAECQWRYMYHSILLVIGPLTDEYGFSLFRDNKYAREFERVHAHLLEVIYEQPIKDVQYADFDEVSKKVYHIILDFINFISNRPKGAGFIRGVWFHLLNKPNIRKCYEELMILFEDTIEMYKSRDNYVLGEDGIVERKKSQVVLTKSNIVS